MPRISYQPPREFWIPKGATKVSDKQTGAVAYLYATPNGQPAAMVFKGKQSKPLWRYRFRDEARREAQIRAQFEALRASEALKAEMKAKRNTPHKLEVGHVLRASWGYDQTNIDYYQVTRVISAHMVEVRKIAAADASKGNEPWMTGKCVPALDEFIGEPMRRRVSYGDRVKIDSVRNAGLWQGRPDSWTAYA